MSPAPFGPALLAALLLPRAQLYSPKDDSLSPPATADAHYSAPRDHARAISLTSAERLLIQLARTASQHSSDLLALHAAVCEHVRELREDGHPPERVVIAVKRLAQDAGLHVHLRRTDGEQDMVAQVVRWCIGAYFESVAPPAQVRPAPITPASV